MKEVVARVYPSTEAKDINSVNNKTPVLKPSDIANFGLYLQTLHPRPTMRANHSPAPQDELGLIDEVWYEEKDKWMWMRALVYPHQSTRVDEIIRHQRYDTVSLGYAIEEKGDYKRLLEFSLTSNPEFQNAKIIECHNSDLATSSQLVWPSICKPPPTPTELSKMTEETPTFQTPIESVEGHPDVVINTDGTIIVQNTDPELLQRVNQYVLEKNMDLSKIIVQDVSALNSLSEEEQRRELRAMIALNEAQAKQLRELKDEEQRKLTVREINEKKRLAREALGGIVSMDDTDASEYNITKIAQTLMNNKDAAIVAQLAAAAKQKEIQKYETEIKKLRSQLQQQQPHTMSRPTIVTHSAHPRHEQRQSILSSSSSSSSYRPSVWTPRSTYTSPILSSSSSSSSSSSFSSSPLPTHVSVVQHNAKREREVPSFVPDNHSDYVDGDFQLFDLKNEQSGRSDSFNVKVVTHSAGAKKQCVVDKKRFTPDMSDQDVARILFTQVLSGEREVGLTYDDLTQSLFATDPKRFTRLIRMTNDATALTTTNSAAGIFGFEHASHNPRVLGFTGSESESKYKKNIDELIF